MSATMLAGTEFTLVSDLGQWENELDPGGLIVGSLHADKFLFIPPDDRPAIEHAIAALRRGTPPELVSRELAGQGVELDVRRLQDVLFYRGLALQDGQAFDGKPNADPLSRSTDEYHSLSRQVLRLDVRRPRLAPRQVRAYGPLLAVLALAGTLAAAGLAAFFPGRVEALVQAWGQRSATGWGHQLLAAALILPVAIASMALHEASHVLMARRFGLYLRSVQWRLYRGIQSAWLVQIPGLCVLPARAQMAVSLAGPGMNWLLAAWCAAAGLALPADSALATGLALTAGLNACLALANLNPFFPTDGYRFFSLVVFRNPDIRSRMTATLRSRGFSGLSGAERIYALSYLASTAAMIGGACLSLWLLTGWLFGFLPPVLLSAVRLGVCALTAGLMIRSSYRFFRPARRSA